MRTNFILLSGAAAIALMGFTGPTPVFAQYAGNPPQYSTPAEKAATQQLNGQGVNGTTEPPAVLNGEATDPQAPQPKQYESYYGGYGEENMAAPAYGIYGPGANPSGSFSGYNQNGPAPAYEQGEVDAQAASDSQQQYNQQMQQYQDRQEDYQNQRQRYERQKDRYDRNVRWYDQAQWAYDYPHPMTYEYDRPELVRLYLIAEPSQQLANVPIEGPNGVWVGRIRNVETASDGTPARIEVALNHRVSVWVDSHRLRFDPNERIAYTNLTREDLWQMPGATVESSPM